MKSTCTVKEPENQFPCLMIHAEEGFVVLFYTKSSGTIVYDPVYKSSIGYRLTYLNIDSFRPFYGSITLSN